MSSPSNHAQSERPSKRPRAVQSCTYCRAKKLKCDRESPCSTCIRLGLVDQCHIDAFVGSLSRTHDEHGSADSKGTNVDSADRHGPRQGIIENLEARVRRLEDLVASSSKDNSRHDLVASSSRDRSRNGDGPSRQRERPSRDPAGQFDQLHKSIELFDNVKRFIKQEVSNASVLAQLNQLRAVIPKYKISRDRCEDEQHEKDSRKLTMLPQPRYEAHVTEYLSDLNHLHPILNEEVLAAELSQWRAANEQEYQMSHLGPVLLLLSALSRYVSSYDAEAELPDPYQTLSAIERWLQSLPDIALRQVTTLQIMALHVLLLTVSGALSPDKIWIRSGNAVRCALAARLHQGRAKTSKMSAVTADMQRALWSAIVELDLQASLCAGLPPALIESDYESWTPRIGVSSRLSTVLQRTLQVRLCSGRPRRCAAAFEAQPAPELNASERGTQSLSRAFFAIYTHRSVVACARPQLAARTINAAQQRAAGSALYLLHQMHAMDHRTRRSMLRSCVFDYLQAVQIMCLLLHVVPGQLCGSDHLLPDGTPFAISDSLLRKEELLPALRTIAQETPRAVLSRFLKELIALSVIVHGLAADREEVEGTQMRAGFEEMVGCLQNRAERGGGEMSANSSSSCSADNVYGGDGRERGRNSVTVSSTPGTDASAGASWMDGFDSLLGPGLSFDIDFDFDAGGGGGLYDADLTGLQSDMTSGRWATM